MQPSSTSQVWMGMGLGLEQRGGKSAWAMCSYKDPCDKKEPQLHDRQLSTSQIHCHKTQGFDVSIECGADSPRDGCLK